jgi:hypothetical protein
MSVQSPRRCGNRFAKPNTNTNRRKKYDDSTPSHKNHRACQRRAGHVAQRAGSNQFRCARRSGIERPLHVAAKGIADHEFFGYDGKTI